MYEEFSRSNVENNFDIRNISEMLNPEFFVTNNIALGIACCVTHFNALLFTKPLIALHCSVGLFTFFCKYSNSKEVVFSLKIFKHQLSDT